MSPFLLSWGGRNVVPAFLFNMTWSAWMKAIISCQCGLRTPNDCTSVPVGYLGLDKVWVQIPDLDNQGSPFWDFFYCAHCLSAHCLSAHGWRPCRWKKQTCTQTRAMLGAMLRMSMLLVNKNSLLLSTEKKCPLRTYWKPNCLASVSKGTCREFSSLDKMSNAFGLQVTDWSLIQVYCSQNSCVVQWTLIWTLGMDSKNLFVARIWFWSLFHDSWALLVPSTGIQQSRSRPIL